MITDITFSKSLPLLLLIAAIVLAIRLYRDSSERDRLIAGSFLTIVCLICLEIVLL